MTTLQLCYVLLLALHYQCQLLHTLQHIVQTGHTARCRLLAILPLTSGSRHSSDVDLARVVLHGTISAVARLHWLLLQIQLRRIVGNSITHLTAAIQERRVTRRDVGSVFSDDRALLQCTAALILVRNQL